MLNYIHQLNRFEELCTGILPPKAQIIYYKLFKWSNRFGLGKPFLLSNSVLMLETGISNINTFTLNRNILKQHGFIDFKPGKPGRKTEYILIDLTQRSDKPLVTNSYQQNVTNNFKPQTEPQTEPQNCSLPIMDNKTKENIEIEREDLCNQDSSSLNEATDIFQNTFRPLKNLDEAEQIKAMVEEYGIDRFKEAVKIAVSNHAKVPLPYLESVLRNNKGSPREKPAGNLKNDAKAGMQRALEILEGDDD